MRTAAVLLAAVLLGPLASSAAASRTIASPPRWGTPVRSYAGWTAWTDLVGRPRTEGFRVVVRAPGGRITRRPELRRDDYRPFPEDPPPLPFDLGPDARGRPSLVFGACDARSCGVRIAHLPDGGSRWVAGTRQRRRPSSVTLWRGAVAWVEGRARTRVRDEPGTAPRTVEPWPGTSRCVDEAPDRYCDPKPAIVGDLELHGRLLASAATWSDGPQGPGFGINAVGILNRVTGHRTTEAAVAPGLNGQSHRAPAFRDGHTLEWLYACDGEPDGCQRGGIRREDLRTHRQLLALLPSSPGGWTPLPGDQAMLATADLYDTHGPLRVRALAFAVAPAR